MVDTVITLGGFEFRNIEIPQSINFGGDQKLSVHELIGGQRVVDAMGPSDVDLSWEGLITGPDALQRALQLDGMRIAGQLLPFSVFNLKYNVFIATFSYSPERFYQVRYTITLKVVQDFYSANLKNVVSFTNSITTDVNNINTLVTSINDPTTIAAVNQLNSDLNLTPIIENATAQQINSLSDDADKAQDDVQTVLDQIAQANGMD